MVTTAVDEFKADTAWAKYAGHIQSLSNRHTGICEVTLTEPGTLAQNLGLTITGNYHKYDSLKIIGPINGKDIAVLRMIGMMTVNLITGKWRL